jgi:hypothetical protein
MATTTVCVVVVSHDARHFSNHLVYQHRLPKFFMLGLTTAAFSMGHICPYFVLLFKYFSILLQIAGVSFCLQWLTLLLRKTLNL